MVNGMPREGKNLEVEGAKVAGSIISLLALAHVYCTAARLQTTPSYLLYRTYLPQASPSLKAKVGRYIHLLLLLDNIQCLFFPPLPRRIPFLTELTLL